MRILFLLLISTACFAQLPSSGSLSIKSAAGAGRSISMEVDGNETGSKSLTTLSTTASKTAPHSMLEFYGYPPAAPGDPQNVVAAIDGQSINITWDAPASGGTPSSYRVEVDGGGGYVFLVDVGTEGYTDNANNYSPSQFVTYRVRAENVTGVSSYVVSNTIQIP